MTRVSELNEIQSTGPYQYVGGFTVTTTAAGR